MRTDIAPPDIEMAAAEPVSLGEALALFNGAFGYFLALPIEPEHVESAAIVASRRGRPEIAAALRSAIQGGSQ